MLHQFESMWVQRRRLLNLNPTSSGPVDKDSTSFAMAMEVKKKTTSDVEYWAIKIVGCHSAQYTNVQLVEKFDTEEEGILADRKSLISISPQDMLGWLKHQSKLACYDSLNDVDKPVFLHLRNKLHRASIVKTNELVNTVYLWDTAELVPVTGTDDFYTFSNAERTITKEFITTTPPLGYRAYWTNDECNIKTDRVKYGMGNIILVEVCNHRVFPLGSAKITSTDCRVLKSFNN